MFTKKDSIKSEVKNSKNSKTSSTEHESSHPSSTSSSQSTKMFNKSQNSTSTQNTPTKTPDSSLTISSHEKADKKGQRTRITVKYDVGFNNQFYIRGKGANLNWDRGTPLKNIKSDEWIWETDTPFSQCEFKVLINDKNYEIGDNHYLTQGSSVVYTPRF